MHLRRSSVICRPFCLGLNVLVKQQYYTVLDIWKEHRWVWENSYCINTSYDHQSTTIHINIPSSLETGQYLPVIFWRYQEASLQKYGADVGPEVNHCCQHWMHDEVMTSICFRHYWPFVQGIQDQNQINTANIRCMMMSSHGNFFHITGPWWGESTGHRWIPLTKGQWCRALMLSLMQAWSCWTNSVVDGDLRYHNANIFCITCPL